MPRFSLALLLAAAMASVTEAQTDDDFYSGCGETKGCVGNAVGIVGQSSDIMLINILLI